MHATTSLSGRSQNPRDPFSSVIIENEACRLQGELILVLHPSHTHTHYLESPHDDSLMPGVSTTKISVKRIVIDVNRTLTVEQLADLDETLKRLGLVKTTKVTLHHHNNETHRTRSPKNSANTVQASPSSKHRGPRPSYDFSAAF
jgi:hypothetical protein